MKTFKVTYTEKEIKSVEEVVSSKLFVYLMYDVYMRKSTLEANIDKDIIFCSDSFGKYVYLVANTIEDACIFVKNEILDHE